MHLNANGFKGLEKIFTNNRVQGAQKNNQEITHFSVSFHHGKFHEKKSLGLKVLNFNQRFKF